jgi:penicillin-binding protein 2
VVSHSFGAKSVSKDVASRSNAWFVGVAPRRNPDVVVVVLWEHGGWGAGSAKLAAQVIQAYVDKQRRVEHNVLQVATEPRPNMQPAEQEPAKKAIPAKPTEVGAIWSDPGNPDALGGRPVKPARVRDRNGDSKLLASVRAGHFFLNESRDRVVGDAEPTRLTAAGGIR